jgi:hypothetical protein
MFCLLRSYIMATSVAVARPRCWLLLLFATQGLRLAWSKVRCAQVGRGLLVRYQLS